jgi:diacylglycerol kinase (ATP)
MTTSMDPISKTLRNSMRGLAAAARSERAVRQELLALAAAGPAAWLVTDEPWLRLVLVGVLLVTLAVELLNTAVEKLCDHLSPEFSVQIGAVKDMCSAAVFCLLATSALVWGAALLRML